ncbi:hypothetical protein L3Q67_02635 [Saccharothrix sp. AJ9571]|nr:hypothetical protein L3Q67_02635 [Saccharothrix sp. AJ9571]
MNSRDWVVQQLREDEHVVVPIGDNGLAVSRPGRPDAVAYCCERSTIKIVTTAVVARALIDLPQTQMVLVFLSQQIHTDTYEFAGDHGLAIGTLGNLHGALHSCDNIGTYQDREEAYVRRRMASLRAVTRVRRKGHSAWVLERPGKLRSITIVTSDAYEVTDLEFTNALNQYSTLAPDAFVATSPIVRGFSDRVSATARDAGIKLLTMNDFVRTLREPWT